MHIMRRRGWEIVGATGHAGGRCCAAAAAPLAAAPRCRLAPRCSLRPGRTADRKPEIYPPGRALTAEKYATTYNNYYEFSDSKDIWQAAQDLKQRPWSDQPGRRW